VVHAELRRGTLKKHFVPVGITNRDKRVSFVPVARPGTKGFLLLSRHGVPGWETGTKKVSQPGQIKVFVVVIVIKYDFSFTFLYGAFERATLP